MQQSCSKSMMFHDPVPSSVVVGVVLDLFPRCAECTDYLPTSGKKNGHMNMGKWLGKYSRHMAHLGIV